MRIGKLQEEVDRLREVGLIKLPARPAASASADGEGEASVEEVGEEKPLLDQPGVVVEKDLDTKEEIVDGRPSATTILPSDSLYELGALLPGLAPKPRPITLTQTLRSLSAQLTSQTLLYSSKT